MPKPPKPKTAERIVAERIAKRLMKSDFRYVHCADPVSKKCCTCRERMTEIITEELTRTKGK